MLKDVLLFVSEFLSSIWQHLTTKYFSVPFQVQCLVYTKQRTRSVPGEATPHHHAKRLVSGRRFFALRKVFNIIQLKHISCTTCLLAQWIQEPGFHLQSDHPPTITWERFLAYNQNIASTFTVPQTMTGICSACANGIVAADRVVKCQGWCNSEFHFSCSRLFEELYTTIESCAQLSWACKACVKFHKDPRTAVLGSSTPYTHTSVDLSSSIADLKAGLRSELPSTPQLLRLSCWKF